MAAPTSLEPGVTLDVQSQALLSDYDAMKVAWADRVASGGMPEYRAFADAVFDRFRAPERDVAVAEVHALEVPGAAASVPARLYRPDAPQPMPLVVFFHGGGWSLGGLDSYDGPVGSLAGLSGCAILAVDYRLAPEHPYPAGLEDALAATRYAIDQARVFGATRRRIGIMGDSAGGNLAAVVARELASAGGPPVAAQFLIYPMTDVASADERFPSRALYGEGRYFLATAGIHFARDAYLSATDVDPANPRVSPLLGEVPAGLAPAFIITAGHDPLRDEAEAYHRRLRAAGVPSKYVCVAETVHAFMSFGVLDAAQRTRRTLAEAMRRMLGGDLARLEQQEI